MIKIALKFIGIICLILIFCFLFKWAIALGKCEILTNKYSDEFKEVLAEEFDIDEDTYFKVLYHSENFAEIYYINKSRYGYKFANTVDIEKIAGEWKYKSWNTIWSQGGSASETIWPYWWHFIYGGV